MAYPVTFDVQPPQEFDKAQVALRVLILLALQVLQIGSIVFSGAYLILPIVAAVMISQKGAERYLAEAESGPYARAAGVGGRDGERPLRACCRHLGEPAMGHGVEL